MIRQSISSLIETSKNRPSDYMDTIYSLSKMDGDDVVFTKENYLLLVEKYSPHLLEEIRKDVSTLYGNNFMISEELKMAHKSICERCEWLGDYLGSKKCLHPNCGCPRSSARIEPWENLLICAAGKF